MGDNGKYGLINKIKRAISGKSKNLFNQNDGEDISESPGVINNLLFTPDEEKSRKEKENSRLKQEIKNAELRTDDNGDITTKKGDMIQDRTPPAQTLEEWRKEIENVRKTEKRDQMNEWRGDWAAKVNAELEKKNLPQRIDHRTLEAQGIARKPAIHMGPIATKYEKMGVKTRKGDINRKIKSDNIEIEKLQRQIAEAEQVIKDIRQDNNTMRVYEQTENDKIKNTTEVLSEERIKPN